MVNFHSVIHPAGSEHLPALTPQVSVEVVQAPHLQLQLVPHGFLQSFSLGRGLSQVLVGLRHQLDLRFQLQTGEEAQRWIFSNILSFDCENVAP